ncbi:hypothetical protein TrST_g4936 [Triparma strigata]|uniref:Protein kinase domain-containing protein n=1 Tax=Triparma strigata TaxID=1606541 RepID=A0A9W7BN13_9STRA|nr:hypothetical protein TrST_g4936 [Triparma strigata]
MLRLAKVIAPPTTAVCGCYVYEKVSTPPPLTPTTYTSHYSHLPFTTLTRTFTVLSSFLPLIISPEPAKLRDMLTELGPAWIKLGQQLSIRPDLLPPSYISTLTSLCDSVPPFNISHALKTIEEHPELKELGELKLEAGASLGCVYSCYWKGKKVAVKVQRPSVFKTVTLDFHVLTILSSLHDSIIPKLTEQKPYMKKLVKDFTESSIKELDYVNEGENQMYFKNELKHLPIIVPSVKFSSPKILITEWITGENLSNLTPEEIKSMIPLGVETFLYMLMECERFHADPHPGNLIKTENGELAILDFGLVATLKDSERANLKSAVKHLLTGQYSKLVKEDSVALGFLNGDADMEVIEPLITKLLKRGLLLQATERRSNFKNVSSELNEIFFLHPFEVPPFFALVTRGVAVLEGVALRGDIQFDIWKEAEGHVIRRVKGKVGGWFKT